MEKLIDFIEKYSIDKTFYCRVNDIYSKHEWEISWDKSESKGLAWSLKKADEDDRNLCSKAELIDLISFYNIDMVQFEAELQAKIKNMIVFVHLMQREAKKILGDDIIDVSLAEYDDFAKSLMDTIKKLLPDHKIPDSVESADSDSKNSKPEFTKKLPTHGLRLVTPDFKN